MRKIDSGFDPLIAAGALGAWGAFDTAALDGLLRPVRGILPMALAALTPAGIVLRNATDKLSHL